MFKNFFYVLFLSAILSPVVSVNAKSSCSSSSSCASSCAQLLAKANSCLGCLQYVDNNGVSIAYTVSGNKGKNCPTIVFIPTWTMSGQAWTCQCKQLSPYFKIVTVNLRGVGPSDQSPTLPISYAAWVSDVEAVVNALGLTNPIIVGFSESSIVAELYAATNSNISKLILVSPYDGQFLNTPNPICPSCPAYSNGVPFGAVAPLLELLVPDRSAFNQQLAQILVPETCNAAAQLRSFMTCIFEETSTESFSNILDSGTFSTSVTASLPSISVPTLLLSGANDPLMNTAGLAALLEAIPNSRLMQFPGGHLFNMTQTSEVNRAIFKFITENPACCDVCCL